MSRALWVWYVRYERNVILEVLHFVNCLASGLVCRLLDSAGSVNLSFTQWTRILKCGVEDVKQLSYQKLTLENDNFEQSPNKSDPIDIIPYVNLKGEFVITSIGLTTSSSID